MSHAEWTADSRAPQAARAYVIDRLGPTLVSGSVPALDDVVLVASELVTNSVRAEARRVCVEVVVDGSRVELVVSDDAAGWPSVRSVGTDSVGGRGLAIVDQLAEHWSARAIGSGKSVTASWELQLP